jgi:HD superfamily phosphodiesterase
MDLPELIDSSEKKLIQPVEDFFIKKYKEGFLISHGLEHHRRVWKYAKELLQHSYSQKEDPDPELVDKLLIACYMHDIGMATDPGEKHGRHSRLLCEEFLSRQNLKKEDFRDVLQVIESHDNKEYTCTLNNNELHKLLSAADDLDAFGYTGIWRYVEIYRIRGTTFHQLGKEIPKNALSRFENFTSVFGQYPGLIEKHTPRFNCLISFFEEYNHQISEYQFDTKNPSGYCGVIEILSEVFTAEILSKSLPNDKLNISDDPVIQYFLIAFGRESDHSN